MKKAILTVFAVPFILAPAAMLAQGMASKGATYITDEEVKQVNALPGIDRTIRVVDIGPENFAVGIIHRGATGAAARGAAPGGGAAAGGGAARGAGAAGGGGGGGGCGGRRRCARGRRTWGCRGGRAVRRAVDGAGDRRHARRDRPRSADRGLPDRVRQRHAGDRRQDRQRPQVAGGK